MSELRIRLMANREMNLPRLQLILPQDLLPPAQANLEKLLRKYNATQSDAVNAYITVRSGAGLNQLIADMDAEKGVELVDHLGHPVNGYLLSVAMFDLEAEEKQEVKQQSPIR